MQRVCVFDVNETLLDLAALDPLFAHVFGDGAARREWFELLLRSAFTATITGNYHDFGQHGSAALTVLAARRGLPLKDEDRQAILTGMRQLPAHADVREGLEQLRLAGLRLATLTNGTEATVEAQLRHAGIRDAFDLVLSADSVQRLKPAPEPYRMAAERLGVPIGEIRLVAAHGWDVAGALRAGCVAAFIARRGQSLDPLAPLPDIVGPTLAAVASQIAEADAGGGQSHI